MSRSSTFETALLLSQLRSLRTVSAVLAVLFVGIAGFVYQNFTPFVLLPIGVATGFGTYAAFGTRRVDVVAGALHDPRLPGVLSAAFFFAIATAVFALRNAYYTKPLLFYAAVAVAGGLVVVRILLTESHLTNGLFAFVFGLTTFVTNQLVYPLGLNGPDSGFHRSFARQIYETGIVPELGTQYVGYPLQHILSASVTHVSGLTVDPIYRTVAILGMVLVLPLTYLIARQFGSREFSLLAVVVVASMDYVVYRVGHPSKMAYALPLLLFIFTFAIYVSQRRATPGAVVLFALFCVALVFTHVHTAFVALILLSLLGIGRWLAPIVEPPLARLLNFDSPTAALRGDGGSTDETPGPRGVPNSSNDPDFGSAIGSRLHVLAGVFIVAFIAQAVFFSGFYGNVVEILLQWVDAILLAGQEGTTQETPRFGQLPTEALLVNTIGSGLLVSFVVLGILDYLERRRTIGFVLLTWLGGAGAVMIIGVIGDAQFALPNRVYVIAQLTAMSFFAAAGIGYLFSQTARSTTEAGRALGVGLVAIVVAFVFFSTASTIAGPGTSPFNDDVPHRMWAGMTEQQAADSFAEGIVDGDLYQAANSFPIDENARFDYSGAEPGTVVYINEYRLNTGVTLQGGPGQIGGAIYAIPQEPRAGLAGSENRIYDNGAVEFYQIRHDETRTPERTEAETQQAGTSP
jgi:hypothetical protein